MIKIICLTETGLQLARRLQNALMVNRHHDSGQAQAEVCFKPTPFSDTVQHYFTQGDQLIFICAMGIVMRTLAPVIKHKLNDPAVLVLDEVGAFVIPLLSGHEGGANELARQVSVLLDNQLVITTANSYLKPVYVVGMGCERNCPEAALKTLLDECLLKAGLTINDISAICSIDIKADELGLISLATDLEKPYLTFDKKTLGEMDDRLSTKSDYIFNTVGVYGVAESAALYQAQQITNNNSELLLNKHKNKQATCAIARSYAQ